MAIYMLYGSLKGSATTDGHDGWCELQSFQWGVGRALGTAARGALNRESNEPHLSEIVVTKVMDAASPDLFYEAVASDLKTLVKIDFTTTTKNQTMTFLKYELTDTGVSSLSTGSGGDIPTESISLNFTKIMTTFTPLDPALQGNAKTVGYDLKIMKSL